MPFLKPLIKTLLASCILFFSLVYLGMEYHWIGFNKNDKGKNIELKIPERAQTLASKSSDNFSQHNNVVTANEEGSFQPQIMQTARSSSLVTHMTKMQVTESCTQLLTKKIADVELLELAIGDCVLSNY